MTLTPGKRCSEQPLDFVPAPKMRPERSAMSGIKVKKRFFKVS
jgi:hypothetical protein